MCMCLAQGSVGGDWIGVGLYESCGNSGQVSVLWWCREPRPGSGGIVLCLCESGFFV